MSDSAQHSKRLFFSAWRAWRKSTPRFQPTDNTQAGLSSHMGFPLLQWWPFSLMLRILICSSAWYCILGDVFWSSLPSVQTWLSFDLHSEAKASLTLVLLGRYIYLTIFQQFPLYCISGWVWTLWNSASRSLISSNLLSRHCILISCHS